MARSSSSSLLTGKSFTRQILRFSLYFVQLRCFLSSRVDNNNHLLTSSSSTSHRQLPTLVPPDHIKCVLSDMDGTLLNSKHHLEDRTVQAITRIMRLGYRFFPCTGRSRKSAGLVAKEKFIMLFGDKLEQVPGVYQQGLTVYGANNTIIYERFLDVGVITDTIQFCRQNDVG